jgi:two-component system, NtrC family, response regulator HydG
MRAEDLELSELVTFRDGAIDLHGRRLVLNASNAFALLRKDLVATLGELSASRILTRYGYYWGQADAAALSRVLKWGDPIEHLKATIRLQSLEGLGRSEIETLEYDPGQKRLHMEIIWHDSIESEEHLTEIGWSASPACWRLSGYVSGCASYCLGVPIHFVETQCRSKGDPVCRAVGKNTDAWGEEIIADLSQLHTGAIQKSVVDLSKALRQRMRTQAETVKIAGVLETDTPAFFVQGRSKIMEEVLLLARRIARFDSSLLIHGESGTGKELLARLVHLWSPRAAGPFLAVNCGALSENLLESELFGHVKGAFTGAIRDRAGLFEQAAGGFVLLDEIGDIGQAMQLKILRVLQEREILRVGESRPRKIDVRVIAATHRNLEEEVRSGEFREDLFYRLRVIDLEVPPLRDRREDIIPLARAVVKKLATRLGIDDLRLDSPCADVLHSCAWRGNVRELENALERAAVMSRDAIIRVEDLPDYIRDEGAVSFSSRISSMKTLRELEMDYIHHVLEQTGGNRTQAARILGIGQTTLWRKLKSEGE